MQDSSTLTVFPEQYRRIGDVVRMRAEFQPHRAAYTSLADIQHGPVTLTYSQVFRRSMLAAANLSGRGARGKRVLIACHDILDWICAFWGCFFVEAIAVPVNTPG